MAWVTITAKVIDAVRDKALMPFDDTDLVRRPDGMFDAAISSATYNKILHLQMPGETVSQTLLRILAGPRRTLS